MHTKKIFIFFSNDLKLYLRRKKRGQGLWCLTPLATTFYLYHDKQGKNKHKNRFALNGLKLYLSQVGCCQEDRL